jgi:hypothetical protein
MKTRFKSKEYSTTRPLEIAHTDLVGTTTTKGLKGEKYFMLLVDDYTRMIVVSFSRISQKLLKTLRSTRKWLKMKWIQKSNSRDPIMEECSLQRNLWTTAVFME